MAQGASIEARESLGFTALISASQSGKAEIVEVCSIFRPLRIRESRIEAFYLVSILCDPRSSFQFVVLYYSCWIALFVDGPRNSLHYEIRYQKVGVKAFANI